MKHLIVPGLACLLCGCAVGPNYQRPVLVPPTQPYALPTPDPTPTAGPAFGDLKWFDVFHDPALTALIRTALSDNFDIRIAANHILQAQQQVRSARGAQLPQVGLGVNGSCGISALSAQTYGTRAKTTDTWELTGTASWQLDLWGQLRRQTEAARANYLAAKANRDLVLQSIVITLAQTYIGLRELDEELAIAQSTLSADQESLKLTKLREEGGVASLVDVKQAESLAETAAHSIPLIQQQISRSEDTINFLLGRNPGPVPRGSSLHEQNLVVTVPPGLPSALLDRRPDIREAEQQLVAANAQIGVAKAALFPNISLTASGGSISTALSDLFANGTQVWAVGGSLLQPVFEGGRLLANYRITQLQKEQLLLNYSKTVQESFREAADAIANVKNTREARIQQEALTNTLAEQRRLTGARYQGGLTTFLEVLDTERQYFSAQTALAQAERDETLAVISLYSALGGGWQQ